MGIKAFAVVEDMMYVFFHIVILESELESEERARGKGSLDMGSLVMKGSFAGLGIVGVAEAAVTFL